MNLVAQSYEVLLVDHSVQREYLTREVLRRIDALGNSVYESVSKLELVDERKNLGQVSTKPRRVVHEHAIEQPWCRALKNIGR